MGSDRKPSEETLDPEDWEAMAALAHRMVDDMLGYLRTVRERPVWRPVPAQVKEGLCQPLPLEPEGAERAYEDFARWILPYPMGNLHPRFWAWVIGSGTVSGMLAEMLAAGLNPNLGGAEHAANQVEAQALDWCKEMLGYPAQAGGILTSGASMANLVGLAVARGERAGFDLRRQGLPHPSRRLMLYASTEVHSSIQKAAELLGLGSDALRRIPVDAEFRMDLAALQAAVAADRAAGHRPICIIGTAGTTNTGAIDDLARLGDISAREGLWFHVDGAFGALAALAPELRHLVAGMERADSLAFDLHKWMYLPYEVGCVLVRDAEAQRRTFAVAPDYLTRHERGLAAGSPWFSDYGPELSRGFRALKVWFCIKEHGIRKFGRLIRQNAEQARHLAELVDASPELERLAPVPLNVVCFRYRAEGLADEALNEINREILLRLQESGAAAPSSTTLNGCHVLRVAITNHRTRREDLEFLVAETLRLGRDLTRVP
ncbi:MAG TPA: pyridoxal-dependent decarboxylase [Burkholderiales bacterium]